MPANDALQLLRAGDPARELEPLRDEQRRLLRDQITSTGSVARAVRRTTRSTRTLQLLAAAVLALVIGVGAAWAAGAISPLSVFENNMQQRGYDTSPASIWNQQVIPSSVVEADSVELDHVGTVGFWYAKAKQGGWCAALRLPSGSWIGTGDDRLDAGGTVPGCFPTREAVNRASAKPVYVINGFDYQEGDVDARSDAGLFWRIRYGRITAPDAARVVDTVSGRSASIVRGDLFLLSIPDAHPMGRNPVHLVAYDAAGKLVADDCPTCG
jgi:hypothetical protein